MTDVVEIAKERREKVAAEVAKLDDFIRIAEVLLKYNLSKSNKASETEDEKAAESTGSTRIHPYSMAAGANGADGAEANA
jgi:hypothetical protein